MQRVNPNQWLRLRIVDVPRIGLWEKGIEWVLFERTEHGTSGAPHLTLMSDWPLDSEAMAEILKQLHAQLEVLKDKR